MSAHKEPLPDKAKKTGIAYPTFIWLVPPKNVKFTNNELRKKFTKALRSSLDLVNDHIMLKLVRVWDDKEYHLCNDGFYTDKGIKRYCEAIDSAIQFWDKHLAPRRTPDVPHATLHNDKFGMQKFFRRHRDNTIFND